MSGTSLIVVPFVQGSKVAQFELKDASHSINLFVNGTNKPTADIYNELNVKVEIVSKNRPTQVLYDLPLKEVHKALKPYFKGITSPSVSLIPLALNQNLVLSTDVKALITVTWNAQTINSISYSTNLFLSETFMPIVVKKVALATGFTDVETDYFTGLLLPNSVKSMETVKDGKRLYQDGIVLASTVYQNEDLFLKVDPYTTLSVETGGDSVGYLVQA